MAAKRKMSHLEDTSAPLMKKQKLHHRANNVPNEPALLKTIEQCQSIKSASIPATIAREIAEFAKGRFMIKKCANIQCDNEVSCQSGDSEEDHLDYALLMREKYIEREGIRIIALSASSPCSNAPAPHAVS